MGYLLDLLIWVFPEMADTLEKHRESASPLYGVILVGLVFVAVMGLLLALGDLL